MKHETLSLVIISGRILAKVDGEIPISVSSLSMSSVHGSYWLKNAIDKNTGTIAASSASGSWFKAKLDKQYCIEKIDHWVNDLVDTHICSRDACTCSGHYCDQWPVSVYSEDGTVPDNAPSNCIIGDTVKFVYGPRERYVHVSELVVIGRGRSLYHWLIIVFLF